MFGTDLTGEYRTDAAMGLDPAALARLARNGVHASFLEPAADDGEGSPRLLADEAAALGILTAVRSRSAARLAWAHRGSGTSTAARLRGGRDP